MVRANEPPASRCHSVGHIRKDRPKKNNPLTKVAIISTPYSFLNHCLRHSSSLSVRLSMAKPNEPVPAINMVLRNAPNAGERTPKKVSPAHATAKIKASMMMFWIIKNLFIYLNLCFNQFDAAKIHIFIGFTK